MIEYDPETGRAKLKKDLGVMDPERREMKRRKIIPRNGKFDVSQMKESTVPFIKLAAQQINEEKEAEELQKQIEQKNDEIRQ